jgi:hypothetical protein
MCAGEQTGLLAKAIVIFVIAANPNLWRKKVFMRTDVEAGAGMQYP